jgi:cytochrome c5
MRNKIVYILPMALLFTFCKTSKPIAKQNITVEEQLVFAQTRWPDATTAQLVEGKSIMENQCVKCHGEKKIANYTEEKWEKEISKMAPKAKINDIQKENLRRYVLTMKGLETK